MNLEEISTVPEIPTGYTKHMFTSKDRKIVNDIKYHADQTCHAKISRGYITNVLNKFKRGVVYYKDAKVKGFAVWKEVIQTPRNGLRTAPPSLPKRSIDVLLVCSAKPDVINATKGSDRIGSRILYDIEQYALENAFTSIALEPMSPDLIDFYRKSGFKVKNLPETDEENESDSILVMRKRVKPLKLVKTNKTRRSRRHSNTAPARGTIEYYNSLVPSLFQNTHTYELLDEYFKRWSV